MIAIGIDPHMSTPTVVGRNPDGTILATTRLSVNAVTFIELLAFADNWPQRQWAVAGASGLGLSIAQRWWPTATTWPACRRPRRLGPGCSLLAWPYV